MIKIIETSREFTKVQQYLLTKDGDIKSLNSVEDGTVIPVHGFLVFTDTKEDGEEVEVLSLMSDSDVYSCQSATFKRSFFDMVEILGSDELVIIKKSGKSRNGRSFIDCVLDKNSVK